MSGNNSTVASPCVGMCDLFQGVCMGCLRHIDEITGWHGMNEAQRRELLAVLARRRELAGPPKF